MEKSLRGKYGRKETINVVKRGDRGKEPLNIQKIHDMVEYAVEDIKGVSCFTSRNAKWSTIL